VNDRRELSFDHVAEEYERTRPSYPPEVLDRLPLADDASVLDLGAGTGKLTRVLADRYREVTAVEPLANMRAVLERVVPGVTALAGSAERIPLDDASVDGVFAAQAFHWFDKQRAVPEMARICRPSGGVAVFWNARADDRSAFLAEHTELTARYLAEEHVDRRTRESTAQANLSAGGFFDVDDHFEIPHEIVMTHHEFVHYVFTASQIRLFVEPDAKIQLERDMHDLMHAHFGDADVVVPYDVDVNVGRRTEVQP